MRSRFAGSAEASSDVVDANEVVSAMDSFNVVRVSSIVTSPDCTDVTTSSAASIVSSSVTRVSSPMRRLRSMLVPSWPISWYATIVPRMAVTKPIAAMAIIARPARRRFIHAGGRRVLAVGGDGAHVRPRSCAAAVVTTRWRSSHIRG